MSTVEVGRRRAWWWTVVLMGAVAPAVQAADLKEIRERGVLRVLVAADEDPALFSHRAEGPPGFERELVESFARSQGLKMEVVPVTPFERIIPALLADEGDLVPALLDTPARRQLIDFTAETLPVRHVVINHEPQRPITTLDSLKAVRVGVIRGTSWEEAVRDAGVPAGNVVYLDSTPSLMNAVKTGRVGAIVTSVIEFNLMRSTDPGFRAGMFVGQATSSSWGVRKQDRDLRAALDAHLGAVKRSGTWPALLSRYFSPELMTLLARVRHGE